MAQYATLKAAITAYVKTNGAQGITGQGLQNILVGMVDILGKYFQNFGGLATPAGSFTAGDENVSFLAIEAGTYTNFGGVTLDGKSLHILVYDGSWDDIDTGIATSLALAETLADYAKVDGDYPQLTVGRAKNIDGTSAIERTFLFDTTAGEADVATGPATVELVKGNSVAWNQLVQNGNFADGTTGWSAESATISVSDGKLSVTPDSDNHGVRQNITFISGHKYYISLETSNAANAGTILLYIGSTSVGNIDGVTSTLTRYAQIFNGAAANYLWLRFVAQESPYLLDNIIIFDLTLMGIDDLTTVAQVEAWLAANVGSKPYYPVSSKILSAKLLGLKTRGFNQWDEEWEVGDYSLVTGEEVSSTTQIRCKNAIPILPSTYYCFTNKASRVSQILWYDADDKYIGYTTNSSAASFTTQSPTNAAYVRFQCPTAYGTTYNHDICINLSWDGSKDGEYEPYEEHDYNLDVTKFYGKLNGEGDYVQLFANGMRKAGSVCDLLDLKNAEADVKVGSLDLGDLSWSAPNADNITYANTTETLKKPGSNNIICHKYTTSEPENTASLPDKSICQRKASANYINVRDSAFAGYTGEQVADALSGVYLYFELDTPAHYTDLVYRDNGVDTPVEALNILVDNWSTEEEVIADPEASGDPNSCAATLDIIYGIDAAEQLDTLNKEGILTGDLKANLEALLGVINTNCAEALGGTLSISENPTDKVYTFTFTPNA